MIHQVYPNAPIAEAHLDIRTRLPEHASLEVIANIKDSVYLNPRNRLQFQLRVESKEKESPTVSHEVNALGVAYANEDGKQIVEFRLDGFSLTRLAPYKSWREISAEAKRLWSIYKLSAKPEFIELLGLNYVNHVRLPLGGSFETYFKTYIEVPPQLPQNLQAFSFNFQVGDPSTGPLVQVAQTYGPVTRPDEVNIIMSIQAFMNINKLTTDFGEEDVWSTFELLRDAKNRAFEACITDDLRRVFS